MSNKQHWEKYCNEQLTIITPLLISEGFILNKEQPHLSGERYVLSGPKLVLYGIRKKDNLKVIIKITTNTKSATELEHERESYKFLKSINFAYQTFKSPEEILFGRHDAYTFLITKYIPQEKTFLERTLKDQFFIALKAFEAQEGSHATTYKHIHNIRKVFEVYDANRYIETLKKYQTEVADILPENKEIQKVLSLAVDVFGKDKELINLYSNFLTHWDFVPHNFRIHNQDLYLLDHVAIRFGNKYEGWARFMNFMMLYNNELKNVLDKYVYDNRNESEYKTLQLMRIYRLSELVWFYVTKRKHADGNLITLTDARINLWNKALEACLYGNNLEISIINDYKKIRNELRDKDEKVRQARLH